MSNLFLHEVRGSTAQHKIHLTNGSASMTKGFIVENINALKQKVPPILISGTLNYVCLILTNQT